MDSVPNTKLPDDDDYVIVSEPSTPKTSMSPEPPTHTIAQEAESLTHLETPPSSTESPAPFESVVPQEPASELRQRNTIATADRSIAVGTVVETKMPAPTSSPSSSSSAPLLPVVPTPTVLASATGPSVKPPLLALEAAPVSTLPPPPPPPSSGPSSFSHNWVLWALIAFGVARLTIEFVQYLKRR